MRATCAELGSWLRIVLTLATASASFSVVFMFVASSTTKIDTGGGVDRNNFLVGRVYILDALVDERRAEQGWEYPISDDPEHHAYAAGFNSSV